MPIAAVFPTALVLALVVFPLAIRVAWTLGYLDHPEARKLHTSATALLGGFAIFVVAFATCLIARIGRFPGPSENPIPLIGGAVIALSIGLWDDRWGMNPTVKFAGQGLAIGLMLQSGALPDLHLGPVFNVAASFFVIISLMNAVNFLDNMNGIVPGMSAIAFFVFAWGSLQRGAEGVAVVQMALAGACCGMLPYNFPRARIFLGDAGSLFLGYSLAASAVLAFQGGPQGWGQLGPILALGYPAFDMIFVVATRRADGRKVSQGGRDHSNHRIASVLKCQKKTAYLLWFLGAALSVSGLVVQRLNQRTPALLLSGLWLGLFLWAGRRLSFVPIEGPPPPTKS